MKFSTVFVTTLASATTVISVAVPQPRVEPFPPGKSAPEEHSSHDRETFTGLPSCTSAVHTPVFPSAHPTEHHGDLVPRAVSSSIPASKAPISSVKTSSSIATSKATPVLTSSSNKPSSTLITTSKASSSSSKSSSKLSSSASSSSAPLPTDYASTGVYYHNKHRLNHSSPALSWNPAQAIIAGQIASNCVFQHNMSVGGGGYGQNLAAFGSSGYIQGYSPSSMLANSIVNQWYYGEVNYFLPSYYGQPTPDLTYFAYWGHFSQLLWAGSTSVGCASQLCPAGTIFPTVGSWFTVCNYVPQGNFLGSFGANVKPPTGQPPITFHF